jgi:hypothetical protein
MQYRSGIINSAGTAYNLVLGFVPDKFTITNYTKTVAQSGVGQSEWIKNVSANASALITTYTVGAPVVSRITSNGITPVSIGAQWYNTVYTITAITNANPGVVTIAGLTPTGGQALVNGATVTISGVVGTSGLNTNRYIVSNLTIVGGGPTYTFTLYDLFGNPVDTTSLGTYVSGGELDMISNPPTAPVLNSVNGQVITPGAPAGLQYDTGYAGVTLGTGVVGSAADVLFWEAYFATPTGW